MSEGHRDESVLGTSEGHTALFNLHPDCANDHKWQITVACDEDQRRELEADGDTLCSLTYAVPTCHHNETNQRCQSIQLSVLSKSLGFSIRVFRV